MVNKFINAKLEWALTDDAQIVINQLVAQGMDRDLAFAILEQFWGENMWSLDCDTA